MCLLMCMPNSLLAFRIVNGVFKSENDIKLLSKMIVPIINLNYATHSGTKTTIQKYTGARKLKNISKTRYKTRNMASKSPDLNIVEDIWKMISSRVYDGPRFFSKQQLTEKVVDTINCMTLNVKN